MSLLLLLGLGSGSPPLSTIGSEGWLLNTTVLRNCSLAGRSTDRVAVGTLRPRMSFLMQLSVGLVIQTHGSAPGGTRAKDWRSSSRIVGPYWSWMAWSPSKIRPVHKKDGYGSLRSRRFCASLQPSIRGFA